MVRVSASRVEEEAGRRPHKAVRLTAEAGAWAKVFGAWLILGQGRGFSLSSSPLIHLATKKILGAGSIPTHPSDSPNSAPENQAGLTIGSVYLTLQGSVPDSLKGYTTSSWLQSPSFGFLRNGGLAYLNRKQQLFEGLGLGMRHKLHLQADH